MKCDSCGSNGTLTQILLDIKEDTASTKMAVEALAGPQGRVTKLEGAASRQFWVSVAVVPVLTAVHAALRKFGVEV